MRALRANGLFCEKVGDGDFRSLLSRTLAEFDGDAGTDDDFPSLELVYS